MITIVEPKKHIADLWGQQRVKQEATFRQMRYILRVDHEGKVLLHNVVTGQLVVLSSEEAEAIQSLPSPYAPVMEELIKAHYLVPEDYDEHQQVVNLRSILRKLEDGKKNGPILLYTILLTTACNARCYYCYEHGIQNVTMNKQTADEVVKFICENCGKERYVHITWFGGEPTIAVDRIDQICKGLQEHQIEYRSSIATNGYLFNKELAQKARKLWNLRSAQICVDGTEKSYNKTKAFVYPCKSPYKKVMRNVGLLLDQGIYVGLRMNFDLGNYQEFRGIIDESIKRFQYNPLLHVSAFPVVGEHVDHDGRLLHGDDSWLEAMFAELNDYARKAKVAHDKYRLPYLQYIGCDADNPAAITIMPDGTLIRCGEQFDDGGIGNVRDGIREVKWLDFWKEPGDYQKCNNCSFFPRCVKLVRCHAKDRCYIKSERMRQTEVAVRRHFDEWILGQLEGDEKVGFF